MSKSILSFATALSLLIPGAAAAATQPLPPSKWVISDYLYTPQTPNLTNLIIANGGTNSDGSSAYYVKPQPTIPGLNILVGSLVNDPDKPTTGDSMAWLSPTVWSGATWTGLEPKDRSIYSQRALKRSTETVPPYGGPVVQVDGQAVGFQLNTFGRAKFPGNSRYQTMTYAAYLDRSIWSTSDHLCVSGQMNYASSDSTTGNSVNMIIFDLYFYNPSIPKEAQAFHIVVSAYDSRIDQIPKNFIHMDGDTAVNSTPIVTTFLQTQNDKNPSKYSIPVPGYGNYLEPYRYGAISPGIKDRGYCITSAQFNTVLADIKATFPNLGFSTKATDYKLKYAMTGSEIFGADLTDTTPNASKGRGRIGMTVNSFWVYRMKSVP